MIAKIGRAYLRSLYARTMREAYEYARSQIVLAGPAASYLECGCSSGYEIARLQTRLASADASFSGVEWNGDAVEAARAKGLRVVQGDLNASLPFESASKDCIYALSVLEHLLTPCAFLKECHRVLRPGGRLVLLTPNISTYFTAALILVGRMPSSGPHPDSNALMARGETLKPQNVTRSADYEAAESEHRHLVVFSFLALRKFLGLAGFAVDSERGFGLYPLPNFMQPLFERLDPYHCHQMVFACSKSV